MVILLIIIGMLLLLGILHITWNKRSYRFKPTKNKRIQLNQLNSDLENIGFAYNLEEDYFYSLMNGWQRETGYCKLYDESAPLVNMIMDCEPVTFSYAGKRWLIELWKGQYGIATGGEIGVYHTSREDINTEKFRGTFYETISDEECLPISFILYKKGKKLLQRSDFHWWLTGFKLGEYSSPESLVMDVQITFPNREMCSSFVGGLRKIGYQEHEFLVIGNIMVIIHYTQPHTSQPLSRNKAQETLVQQVNKNNYKLYKVSTKKYRNTLDKLEYLKAEMPEVYPIFLNSIDTKGLYQAFEWIKDTIYDENPDSKSSDSTCPPKL